jgi:hypothetical protein
MSEEPTRPGALIATAVTLVLAGAVMGGVSNAVNGGVSGAYFVSNLGWDEMAEDQVHRAAVAQGIFEGLIFGLVSGLLFTCVVAWVSRVRCAYPVAVRYVLGMLGTAVACWVVGGLVALGLAWLSPEFFRETFHKVPEESGEALRYAWVGGSIMGAQWGCVFAVPVACLLFRARWRRAEAEAPSA